MQTSDYGWRRPTATHDAAYIAPKVVDILRRLNVHRVLDFGSGNGTLCARMLELSFDPVGVEADQKGVEIARTAHPGIPFHRFSAEDGPSRLMQIEKPFDVVVSTEVVEHLYSPHLLVNFARDALIAEGYLVISTPHHGYLKNLALALLGKMDAHYSPLWHGGHIKFWSRKTLTELLESNGFRVTEFHGAGRLPWLWKSMILVAQKG